MKRLVYINTRFLPLLVSFCLFSCLEDKSGEGPELPLVGETAEITVLADAPAVSQVATRGQEGTAEENNINEIHILVFDKSTQELVSKSKGKGLDIVTGSENGNKVSFKATLPVGTEYTFMVLANAANILSGIDVGMTPVKTRSDVEALTVGSTGKWDATAYIPMWGEKDLTLTASSTPSFELTRMLARVNVEVNLREVSGVKPDNFRLTSVRYYNYNTAGAVIPSPANYDVTQKAATAPTIPSEPGTRTGEALLYDGTDITSASSCSGKIYIFEAAHNGNEYYLPQENDKWTDNPCLVIGGEYRTENGTWLEETFYRVDFIRKDNTDPDNIRDIWLSVLRNFSYNVTITQVSGSGFPDPGVALKSAPINMEANVLDWNESGMGEIVFDGVFYLSVSRDQFIFQRKEVSDEQEEYVLYVKTDYVYENNKNHSKSGWYVEKYVDAADGTTEVNWLELNPDRGAPDDKVKAHFTFRENTTADNRSAIVWIAAGRLRYPVHVTQRVLSLEITDPENNNVPITEMRFTVPRAGDPGHPSRQFRVNWTPADFNVGITHESPEPWSPFAPEWLDPDPSLMTLPWTISGGSGSQLFEVNAPAVSQELIDLDPFYERETVYSFTVSHGSDSETQNITLHQIYYNILVDTYRYRLDGGTYNMTVRSNTEWKITNIEEWLFNEPPSGLATPPVMISLNPSDNLLVGTQGGPNVNGESISFTVVDQKVAAHKQKWGTVWVTFESPDGKFDPVRVELVFPARKMTILGLGYSIDDRCYNPAFPTGYHRQGTNRLLTAEVNFGNTTESTFKVDGLDLIGFNCQDYAYPKVANQDPDNYTGSWRKGFLEYWMNKYNPDIIILTYSIVLQAEESKLIVDYLKQGGAVIMYYGGDVSTADLCRPFFNELFETTFTAGTDPNVVNPPGLLHRYLYPVSGAVYKYKDIDDPVLTGPFEDVRNQYWGCHEIRVGVRTSLIEDKVHVLATTDEEFTQTGYAHGGYTLIFRHKEYNLLWVGNTKGTAGYYVNDSYDWYDPIRINEDFTPAIRPNFRAYSTTNPRFDVYNSYFFANAVAWAIGATNHTPPPNGYES